MDLFLGNLFLICLGKRIYIYVFRGLRVKRVELKLEVLTGGVLQSAFNNFAKFTIKVCGEASF